MLDIVNILSVKKKQIERIHGRGLYVSSCLSQRRSGRLFRIQLYTVGLQVAEYVLTF